MPINQDIRRLIRNGPYYYTPPQEPKPKPPKKPLSLKDFFNLKRQKKLTFGLEVEMFLCNINGVEIEIVHDCTNEDGDRERDDLPITFIIDKTNNKRYFERVYRDYYYNQLEIRTPPFVNPNDMIKDIKKTYSHIETIVDKFNSIGAYRGPINRCDGELMTLPTSVMRGMNTTCGTHLHIRPKNLFNTFVNSYPLLIPFMENSQCSPHDQNILSIRQTEDRHISPRNIDYAFDEKSLKHRFNRSQNRNCDIIINKNKKEGINDRHRIKTINTLEYRVFDTNWDFDHMKKLLLLFSEALRYLKQDRAIKYDRDGLFISRKEAIYSKHGYNYIFDKPNVEVLCELSEMFGMDINKFSTPIRKDFYQDTYNIRPRHILPLIKW